MEWRLDWEDRLKPERSFILNNESIIAGVGVTWDYYLSSKLVSLAIAFERLDFLEF
jgi:hypothetical protein